MLWRLKKITFDYNFGYMKKILFIALCLPLFAVAQSKTKGAKKAKSFQISGAISGFPDSTLVDFMNGSNGTPISSTYIKDGKFSFTGTMEVPEFRLLSFEKNQQQMIPIFLDNSNVTVTGSRDAWDNIVIKGSGSHDDFVAFSTIFKPYEHLFNPNAQGSDEENKAASEALENFVKKNKGSYITPIAIIRNYQLNEDGEKMAELYGMLKPEVKETAFGKYIEGQLGDVNRFPIGKPMEDFSQADTSGKQIKLSDFKGKYVLVDFWASWCGPCRVENPNVVKVFEKYKDKNFTVFGVSLDKSRDPWIAAIYKDHLTWPHVSDLKGWNNEVAVKFHITSIPQNLLLDPNGNVIAKNLRGEALAAKLASILD